MQLDIGKVRNGTGALEDIKNALRLLEKTPKNNGYFRKFLAAIDRLAQERASLILQRRIDEDRELSQTLAQLADDERYKRFFDHKKALESLLRHRTTVEAAERRIQSARGRS